MGQWFAADDTSGAAWVPAHTPLLLALLRNSADLVGVLDRDGTLRFFLPEDMFGFPEGALAGRFALELLHPDDVEEAATRLLDASAQAGTTEPFQCRVRQADGSWRWFEIIGSNQYDNPAVNGLVFSGRDITDRKRAEEALKGSERRWRSLLQASNEQLSVMGPDGSVIFHIGNQEMLGFGEHELLDFAKVLERTHPDDRQAAIDGFAELIALPGRSRTALARIRHTDGSWRWIESIGCNLLDDPDVAGILITSRDVTEREEAGQAKREAEEKLRHSALRWRRILQTSREPVTIVDAEGTVIQTTANGQMLGYAGDGRNGVGHPFALVHPDDKVAAVANFAKARATPGEHPPRVLRMRHADGTYRLIESKLVNLLDDPEVRGIVITLRDVTEREEAAQAKREAEEDVMRSERRWRRVLDSSTEQVAVVATDGTYLQGTGTGRLLGYEGWAPRSIFEALELMHPDDQDRARGLLATVVSGSDERAPFVGRVRHADGSWRWVESTLIDLRDDPDIEGIVVTTRDVTEREEAERARREAEADAAAVAQRWRRVMDKATEPVTVVGADGSIIQSTANGRMLGYGPEDEIGSMFELVHPDDIDIAIEAFRRVRKTLGEHAPYLTRVRHADGSWRWIEARAMNLLDDPEVEGIVINTRDVTEREEADAARRRAETKLVESERRWRRLVQTSTEHITVIAPDGQVLFHSGSEGTLGRRDEDLPRQLEGMLQLLHPDDLERSIELFAKVVADPTPIPPIEVRLLHVDGTYRWSESIARNLCDDPDIGGIVVTSRDITARREAEAELAHQGTHDPLTGLPNRVLCLDRLRLALSRLERNPMAVGVLLLDLDRFKVVNDSLGHSFGDRILVAAAERLQGVARPGDTVARLGGDEFVIVCDGIHGEVEAVALADKVRAALAERFLVDGAEISLTASVGIAVTGRADTDPDELLRDVDAVMYRAKERGRDRWEVFDEDLRTRAVERLSTETALRRALENDELRLHFQPIVDLASGQTIGAEGLIRWEHPTRGLLAPASFVRIAEESGLVTALGDRVLRDGCHQLAQWTKAHPDLPLTVSLNVAAQQLAHGHLVRTVKAALDESGADPSRLCLELTETALLEDFEMATSVLRKLRTLGIQLWVDDFGTGYSSLAYLRRLPLDGLKIDRSFVAGLLHEKGDRAIVSGTIHLAQSFELLALAEGVETREQARALVDMGCTQGQGYLWSSPLPPDAFDTWLAGN